MNEGEAGKIRALAHRYYDIRLFPVGWDPFHVSNHDARGNVKSFVGAVRPNVNKLRRLKGSLFCQPYFSLRQQCAQASVTLEYWQDALKEVMPGATFGGRGWDIVSGKRERTRENEVVLSEHSVIGPDGKPTKMICQCSRMLAPRRQCRGRTSGKRRKPCVAVRCGCQGLRGRVATQVSRVPSFPWIYVAPCSSLAWKMRGFDSRSLLDEGSIAVYLCLFCH